MKTAMKQSIAVKTEEYRIKKNNLSINGYLTTFVWDGVEYSMIHLGGYHKVDKHLIAGTVPEKIMLTDVFKYAYFWGTFLWNDTYLSSDGEYQMTILRHEKTAYITSNN